MDAGLAPANTFNPTLNKISTIALIGDMLAIPSILATNETIAFIIPLRRKAISTPKTPAIRPSIIKSPSSYLSKPAMMLSNVVLPLPLVPKIDANSFCE